MTGPPIAPAPRDAVSASEPSSTNEGGSDSSTTGKPRQYNLAPRSHESSPGARLSEDEEKSSVSPPGRSISERTLSNVSVRAGGGAAPQQATQSQSLRSGVIQELQATGLSEQKASTVLDKLANSMFSDVRATATRQGVSAYARTFGVAGIAARTAGQITNNVTSNPTAKYLVSTVPALLAPLIHGEAGKHAAPARDKTQFVKNKQVDPFPPNTGGNAFAPFKGHLAYGNTGMAAAVEIPIAATHKMSGQATLSTSEISVERNTASAIKSVLLTIPGAMAGAETARNLYAARAEANWSLQQPIKTDGGDLIGVSVTHQKPVDLSDPDAAGHQRQELGFMEVDANGQRYKASIVRTVNENKVSIVVNDSSENIPEKTEGVKAKASETASSFLSTAGKTLTTFNWQTGVKVTSLASTLAATAIIGPLAQAASKGLIETMLPSAVAEPLSQIAGAAATNYLLGNDFIPKFMTFGNSSAPLLDSEKKEGEHLSDIRNKPIENMAKVAMAAIPIVGGKIAENTGAADPNAAVKLTSQALEGVAARQVDMLLQVSQMAGSAAFLVSSGEDGVPKLDASAVLTFFIDQSNDIRTTPSQADSKVSENESIV